MTGPMECYKRGPAVMAGGYANGMARQGKGGLKMAEK